MTVRLVIQFFSIMVLILQSCANRSSNTCEWEKVNYSEKWDFEVASSYRYRKYKATYVIQTTTGKKILFRPIQDIVAYAERGDRVIKDKYAQFAYLIHKDGDTLRSRIFSTGCDSMVGVKEKSGQRW